MKDILQIIGIGLLVIVGLIILTTLVVLSIMAIVRYIIIPFGELINLT